MSTLEFSRTRENYVTPSQARKHPNTLGKSRCFVLTPPIAIFYFPQYSGQSHSIVAKSKKKIQRKNAEKRKKANEAIES